jgi:hypothetical protein
LKSIRQDRAALEPGPSRTVQIHKPSLFPIKQQSETKECAGHRNRSPALDHFFSRYLLGQKQFAIRIEGVTENDSRLAKTGMD